MTNALKTAVRSVWALGDYHRFATATVWSLGPVLVNACGIRAGQRVLDVAAGTGNVAIRAAQAGATVVAADLTPEQFDAGRQAARAAGVDLTWVEGDAEALPFEAGEFDVVTSCFGAMFAPDHQQVADELLRVCRPGGVIGMINFTPAGAGGDFFRLLAPYLPPPPPEARPPLLWGDDDHVRALFGGRVETLTARRQEYVEAAASARDYHALFRQSFGPMVAIYASLADRPEAAAGLEREFLEFVGRWNRNRSGAIEMPYEYLLVTARKADAA
jgi:ubiquinone/menaquinone biosynthesis C-methylase UbiE